MKRYLAWILTLVLVAGLLCGCGAESVKNGAAADTDAYYRAEAGEAPEMLTDSTVSNSTTYAPEIGVSQKLIRKIYIDAETEDLDALLSQVDERIKELGGYCESRDIYNGSASSARRYRRATLTVRIPAAQLDQFVDHVSGASNVTSTNETSDDITLTYIATESRVNALQTEHDRLLELLAKAESMSDLLEIESRLTNVRAELEQIASQLKLYDNMVSYGTVNLTISEVKEYTVMEEPETFWERIGNGFMDSLEGVGIFFRELFVFIIVALPYLVLIGVVVVLIVIIIKKRKKNKKEQ